MRITLLSDKQSFVCVSCVAIVAGHGPVVCPCEVLDMSKHMLPCGNTERWIATCGCSHPHSPLPAWPSSQNASFTRDGCLFVLPCQRIPEVQQGHKNGGGQEQSMSA